MINKEDPSEWLAQIELTPASAPVIVRTLVSRIKSLDETNEELRNENIALREKIDTKAYQKELEELKRQLRTFTRLVKYNAAAQGTKQVVLSWSEKGYVFALDAARITAGEPVYLPHSHRMDDQKIRLLGVSAVEDVLFLTNMGRAGIFEVETLMKAAGENLIWQKLPDLKLEEKEFIALMLPVGLLPLSESLVTLSVRGYARSIHRLVINQFLQNAQFGKGVTDARDVQVYACLVFDRQSDAILFTSRGNHLRFASETISPSPAQALKLELSEQAVGVVPDDPSRPQVLAIDRAGQAARRLSSDFSKRTIGVKPQPAFSAEQIVAVQPVDETGQVVILSGDELKGLTRISAAQVPLHNKTRPLAKLPGLSAPVLDFVCMRSGK
jgi:DNA gyrase/topoisomerase IV subunit A